jgi:hypothetical protein
MQLNFALLGILEALVRDKAELDQAIRSGITMEDLQDCFDEEPDNDDGEVDGCCTWRCFKSIGK